MHYLPLLGVRVSSPGRRRREPLTCDSMLEEIGRRMRHGESIDDVDLELIERTGLSQDAKAALWLYAWSFVPRRKQRASAELHLRLVKPQGLELNLK